MTVRVQPTMNDKVRKAQTQKWFRERRGHHATRLHRIRLTQRDTMDDPWPEPSSIVMERYPWAAQQNSVLGATTNEIPAEDVDSRVLHGRVPVTVSLPQAPTYLPSVPSLTVRAL